MIPLDAYVEGRAGGACRIASGNIVTVINTPTVGGNVTHGRLIRKQAIQCGRPLITTVAALQAAVAGIEALRKSSWGVRAVQDWSLPAGRSV